MPQTAWRTLNITGHVLDGVAGEVDDTEANGAFDSIVARFRPHCPSNFDNGGGEFDVASAYVENKYGIKNVVFDPFKRSVTHNTFVLSLVEREMFDCCTSLSVLNVIDCPLARSHHISLCYQSLKRGHSAFFKIWPGDSSGRETKSATRYQSNRGAATYLTEIQHVFGAKNVTLVDHKTIVATKPPTPYLPPKATLAAIVMCCFILYYWYKGE